VVYDFINVVNGEATLRQALIRDKRVDNLYVLPASQTRDKDALTVEGVGQVIDELRNSFDYVVCDSPAGIEHGALMAMYFADEALVVTNAEVSAVRDCDRILGILASKTLRAEEGDDPVTEHLLLSRYSPRRAEAGDMMTVEDVTELLGIPLLGVVPESDDILQASNEGRPVIFQEQSRAAQAYDDVIARFLGEDRPQRFITEEKKSLLGRFFNNHSR
jgi:septum site-determining protein MinD